MLGEIWRVQAEAKKAQREEEERRKAEEDLLDDLRVIRERRQLASHCKPHHSSLDEKLEALRRHLAMRRKGLVWPEDWRRFYAKHGYWPYYVLREDEPLENTWEIVGDDFRREVKRQMHGFKQQLRNRFAAMRSQIESTRREFVNANRGTANYFPFSKSTSLRQRRSFKELEDKCNAILSSSYSENAHRLSELPCITRYLPISEERVEEYSPAVRSKKSVGRRNLVVSFKPKLP